MNTEQLALRPYIEKVEKICTELQKQELVALVVSIASEVASTERRNYLNTILRHLSGGNQFEDLLGENAAEQLLEEIQELTESILERIMAIEDGSYWEDPDEGDWEDDYYADDPDYLNDSHKTTLASCFSEADDFFLQNKLPESIRLYEALFKLISEVEKYGFMPEIDVDLREAHARYCRAVYDCAKIGERVEKMQTVMAVTEPKYDFDNLKGDDLALFQDVIDAKVGELPDIVDFLPQWEMALRQKGCTQDRLARLRLETAYMLRGHQGVSELAQSWEKKQPLGYLVWMQYLAKEEKWKKLCDAANKALVALPMGSERRIAAENLVEAGRKTQNDDLVFKGRKEAYRSSSNDQTLLLLIDEAECRKERETEISWATNILLQNQKENYGYKRLLARLFLMAGDLHSLAELCKKEKVYGWSGGTPGALMFCAVLYCAGNKSSKNVLINQMLSDYAEGSIYFDSHTQKFEKPQTTFLEEIKRGLAGVDISRNDFTRQIQVTLQNGEKRVEHIVKNKYRNAYGRAAYVLGSMAEMFVAQGEKAAAKELIHKYYFKLFNRFSAFRREVKSTVAASSLLTGMGLK